MTTIWILIANASAARIYSSPKARLFNGHAQLNLIAEFNHDESRQKSSDLIAGRAGHFNGGNGGHGTFVESGDPRKAEAEVFARELSAVLEKGRIGKAFGELIIAASPSFHGILNKQLHAGVNGMVSKNIEKDYTNDDDVTLISHIQQFL